MQTIKFTTCLSGHGTIYNPGDVVEVDDAEAARLIAVDFAVAVKPKTPKVPPTPVKKPAAKATATTPDPVVETATVPDPATDVAITIDPVDEQATTAE